MEDQIWWCLHQIRCHLSQDIILGCHLLCILKHQWWIISGFLRLYIFRDLLSVVLLKEWFRQILHTITQWWMVIFLPIQCLDVIWIPSILPHSNNTLQKTLIFLLFPDFQALMKVQQTMWQKMRKRNKLLISSSKLYNSVTMSIIIFHNSIILLFLVGPSYNLNLNILQWCTTR